MDAPELHLTAATVTLQGPAGAAGDATLVRGRLVGVAAGSRAEGAATGVLEAIAAALGPRPSRWQRQQAISARASQEQPERARLADVEGVAIVLAAGSRLLLAQVGRVFVYHLYGDTVELLTHWWQPELELIELLPGPGDRLVVCTGGYWPLLDRQLLAALSGEAPAAACARLRALAVRGGVDHAAAVVLAVGVAERPVRHRGGAGQRRAASGSRA